MTNRRNQRGGRVEKTISMGSGRHLLTYYQTTALINQITALINECQTPLTSSKKLLSGEREGGRRERGGESLREREPESERGEEKERRGRLHVDVSR